MQNLITDEKSIGGYIGLDLPLGEEYYPSLLKLNTGRNALEYILRIKKFKLIHLPYFTCEAMIEPLEKLSIECKFYQINQNLEPVTDFKLGVNDCLLYTNYFGLKQGFINQLSKQIPNLIIDNSQAFFSDPLPGVDTFYSCRKFFGVPDGAYLQLNSNDRLSISKDNSINRFSHLIKNIDLGVEAGYNDFIENNVALNYVEIREMSTLTRKILAGINYDYCKKKRNENYLFLKRFLEDYNELPTDNHEVNGPMVYPLLTSNSALRKNLIDRKIYIPTYWPNVFNWTTSNMYENYLANNLVSLPIDHRYNLDDMRRILNAIIQFL